MIKFRMVIAAGAVSVWMLPGHAAALTDGTATNVPMGTSMTTNSTTITASTLISPGRYMSAIAPNINDDMAKRLEKALGKVRGIEAVTMHVDDSTMRFTVKNGASVRLADLQKAVAKTDAEAVMTVPVLEHSETPHMGL